MVIQLTAKTMENQIKTTLVNGGQIFYDNGEDMAHSFLSKLTGRFCFSINGKVIFGYKNFNQFKKNIDYIVKKHSLKLSPNE